MGCPGRTTMPSEDSSMASAIGGKIGEEEVTEVVSKGCDLVTYSENNGKCAKKHHKSDPVT